MLIKNYNFITSEELELLLRRKPIDHAIKSPVWLSLVRMLPCAYIGCKIRRAGTAHHVFSDGIGMKCSDFLTIPLCITHHLTSNNPVQGMNDKEFKKVIGMSKADAVRRTYTVIMDKLSAGDLV